MPTGPRRIWQQFLTSRQGRLRQTRSARHRTRWPRMRRVRAIVQMHCAAGRNLRPRHHRHPALPQLPHRKSRAIRRPRRHHLATMPPPLQRQTIPRRRQVPRRHRSRRCQLLRHRAHNPRFQPTQRFPARSRWSLRTPRWASSLLQRRRLIRRSRNSSRNRSSRAIKKLPATLESRPVRLRRSTPANRLQEPRDPRAAEVVLRQCPARSWPIWVC